jgi:hypothetical protein
LPIPARRFREAPFGVRAGVVACADLLRVSERTGKVLGPDWRDFFVYRNVLITRGAIRSRLATSRGGL